MRPQHAFLFVALLVSACASEAQPESAAPAAQEDPATATDPVSDGSVSTAASCVEIYSPEALAGRSFAFDGTVKSIESRTDPKLPVGQAQVPWVTFDVHQWFIAGSGDEVGIWMDGLNVDTSAGTIAAKVDTRLLVSGEPRWGGEPLDDPLAWTCGFTQSWSEEMAAEWRAATA